MSLADAIYYQALIYIRAGRPQEAIPFLRRAQMLHSGLGRTNQATLLEAINLCRAYAEIGDSPAARRACSDITYLLRSPNPPFKTRVLVNLATLDVASGNYIQAIERLNEAIASGTLEMGSSAILSALKLRAQAYAGIGKYANAYRDASHYAEGQRTASEEDQSFAVEAVRTRAELNERDMRRIELQQALSYARNMSRQRQIQLILSCTIFFIIMAAGLLLYISRMRHRRMVVQRAENKLAMITDINHEIRGPLASMSLLISALRNRSSLPEAHAALVEQIDRGAQQVISLLSESLEFTKLQYGGVQLKLANTGIRSLLTAATDLHRLIALERGLTFILDIDPVVPEEAMLDPLRLRQVLDNLLSNALRFTSHGRIGVYVCVIERGRTLRVEITNTGTGISQVDYKVLFKRFGQGTVKAPNQQPSTGLGLPISRELVLLMGGQMGAGEGRHGETEFWFEIPLIKSGSESIA